VRILDDIVRSCRRASSGERLTGVDVDELKSDPYTAGLLEPVDEEEFDWLREFAGRAFGSAWRPLPVKGVVDRDYPEPPSLDAAPMSTYLAISERAVAALADLVEGYAEILPLDSDPPGYHLLHPTCVLDALDEDASEVNRLPTGRVSKVHSWVLGRGLLEGVPVFKLPPFVHGRTYATDLFARAVAEAGLTGFDLRPLRPLAWAQDVGARA